MSTGPARGQSAWATAVFAPACRPWVVFMVALLLHVGIVFAIGHYKHPVTWENGMIAANMMDGRGFAIAFRGESEATSWQAPGYPYLLFFVWKTMGENAGGYLFISLLQALLVSSIVFPVGKLTEHWFGRPAAVVARWIVCLMPLYGWYPTRIHQPAMVMFFHPWLLWAWLSLTDRKKWQNTVATGSATGLAGLFQPVMLAVFGLIAGGLLLKELMKRNYGAALSVFAAGLCTLAVLTPWTLRNFSVHDRFVLVKNSFGKELWMGNNPHATGSAFAEGGTLDVFSANPPSSWNASKGLPEIKVMDALLHEAVDYVRSDIPAFLVRTAKKVAWFWTAVPRKYLRVTMDGEAVKFYLLHVGYWTGFLILALVARLGRGRFARDYANCLLLYFTVYSITYGLTIVGNARFRGEMEYIFIPAVAAGVVFLLDKLGGKILPLNGLADS